MAATDLVDTVDINAGDRFCIRATWATAALQGIRPSWALRIRSKGLTP